MLEATQMLGAISSWVTVAAPLTEGNFPWLTVLTFAPLVGVIALMLVPKEQLGALRNTAFFISLGVFFLSLGLLVNFDPEITREAGAFTFQMTEGPVEWIPAFGISYFMGIDGFSLWLILLTTFLMPIAIYSTYSAVDKNVKEYMIALLFLEAGMIGALVSLDVFLFYIFWEMMLIPMYLIIGVWGGEKRILASVKFFLYTMVGSLLMLVSILYVYFQTGGAGGEYSFLLTEMLAVDLSAAEQGVLFAAFFLAFAIKVPLFPFHTWLPLAHVQAPTAGSVILAGVLLKMGTYGLIRYAFPLFPEVLQSYAPYIATLAVIGVVYGALVAMVQDDVKKLVAYSSVSHLGFCVLGLIAMTPQGLAGGMYVMIAHGVATGGLFLCVGILKERRHTKKIA
ncbi:MAG: complex I subunit 4 family protein, partial [Persicimonas sp.]